MSFSGRALLKPRSARLRPDLHKLPGMRWLALAVLVLALLLAGYGVWLLATPDYQGGRDAAATLFLASAAVLGLASVAALIRLRLR
jgi:hypothetical protein